MTIEKLGAIFNLVNPLVENSEHQKYSRDYCKAESNVNPY